MKAAIEANAATLERLCVFDSLFKEIPSQMLGNLIELNIWSPRHIDRRLGEVFLHAPQLESLTLADVNYNDIFPVLHEHAAALPRLTALKLMSIDPVECERCLVALVRFLGNKHGLRRLDVCISSRSLPRFAQTLTRRRRSRTCRAPHTEVTSSFWNALASSRAWKYSASTHVCSPARKTWKSSQRTCPNRLLGSTSSHAGRTYPLELPRWLRLCVRLPMT